MRNAPNAPILPATFSVIYTNPPALNGAFWNSWQIMLIVLLVVVGGPVWIWLVMQYMQKRANAPMDLDLLLFAAITAADVFSFTLVVVLFLVSWWLCGGKLHHCLCTCLPLDER